MNVPMPRLRDFTTARVGLGRAGNSLTTREHLELQLAHARAREAVRFRAGCSVAAARAEIRGGDVTVQSAAPDRAAYVRRPDLGRRLNEASRELVSSRKGWFDGLAGFQHVLDSLLRFAAWPQRLRNASRSRSSNTARKPAACRSAGRRSARRPASRRSRHRNPRCIRPSRHPDAHLHQRVTFVARTVMSVRGAPGA
jgi:hypothetical protein